MASFKSSCAIGDTSGQSYKASPIVIYDSRVVPYLKIPQTRKLRVYIVYKMCHWSSGFGRRLVF